MNRRFWILAALAIGASVSGCAASRRTAHPIEGSWNIVEATRAGQVVPLAAFGSGLLKLDAGNYEFQADRGNYVVLPGTAPAQLDLHGREGPNVGRTILAIFTLERDVLVICYDLSGKARPVRLESTPDNGLLLIRYRRA